MHRLRQKVRSARIRFGSIKSFAYEAFTQLRTAKQTIYPSNTINSRGPSRQKALVFIHIPKTGGTSLLRITEGISCYHSYNNTRIPVTAYHPPILISPEWQGAFKDLDISKYPISDSTFSIFSSHCPFGLHQKLGLEAEYLTILRNPVDREVSCFNHHFERNFLSAGDSIESLISSSRIMDNPQTRLLAGPEHCLKERCDKETFEIAKKNLESFLLVGVTEHFQEFISELLSLYSWPAVQFKKQRVTAKKFYEISNADIRKILEEFHEFDLKLHEIALKRWNKSDSHLPRNETACREVLDIPWHFPLSNRVSIYQKKV